MKKWKRLNSEVVFSHRKFNLTRYSLELPNGNIADDYYVVEENDIGEVFAITQDNFVIFVEQYKHGINDITLELPAGLFNDKNGSPLVEARREFLEETGYDAESYHYIGAFVQNPTRLSNKIHLFLAINAHKVGEQSLDTTEEIQVHLIQLDNIYSLIKSGKIDAVGSVAGIFIALENLPKIRQKFE